MGPPNDVKPSLRKATNTSWTPLLNASPAKSELHGLAGKSANAGAEAVAMMAEFVDHPLPVDLHLCRMMQDVKPDEARQ